MKETMTIHQALSTAKILDSRIDSGIAECEFAVANKHSNSKVFGVPIPEYVNSVREKYQSVQTLINRLNAIRQGIANSNANTIVTIAGKKYTVAEAIYMKSKGLDYTKELLGKIKAKYEMAKRTADRENGDKLESRTDDYIKTMYQGADMKNMAEEIKRVRDDFIAAQTVEVVDPIGAASEITRIEGELDAFMAEVDSALSVSNALTTIEVEYETK